MVPAAVGAGSLQVAGQGCLCGGPGTCKRSGNRKKVISGSQPRCWLDLAPLSTRTALLTSPLGDLGSSRELVEPPWLVMRASPGGPAADSRVWLKRGGRAQRIEVHRSASLPVARLPCWCLRRGRTCRAWARRPVAAPRPRAQGQHMLLRGARWWIHRRGERNPHWSCVRVASKV